MKKVVRIIKLSILVAVIVAVGFGVYVVSTKTATVTMENTQAIPHAFLEKKDEITLAQEKINEAERQLKAEEDKYIKEKASENKKHEDVVAQEKVRNDAELARIEAELDRIRAVRMSFTSAPALNASSTQ
jgi:hypothetical protein